MGRLTKNPDIRTYGDEGKKMARFTLAVDRRGRREEGQQTADFIPCICYGHNADFADTYLRQGTKIVVTGSINTGSYENKEGQRVYTMDVMVQQMEFAESKKASGQSDVSQGQPSVGVPGATQGKASDTMDGDFLNIPDSVIEENLPFN